ncbi:MAG: hypothetical protein JRI68_11245 [Deltaproteobacteria bacterium]|nr:hypothetical protein [Deltaproteobacteria bacterium]
MDLEQAIKTAIEYEEKVVKTYDVAQSKATNEVGKRVFGFLADEERRHVEYLESRLAQWQKEGKLVVEKLDTVVPAKTTIDESLKNLESTLEEKQDPSPEEIDLLQQALQAERETSDFYKRMVEELDGDGQRLFERFVEIEEGHVAIVDAEIAALSGLGFWFDMAEFNLEA